MSKTLFVRSGTTLPLIFAAVLTVGCASTAMSQPAPGEQTKAYEDSEQPVNDGWITTKVKADLLATENVSGLDIKVETVDGVVTLTGAVTSQAQKDKAVEVARQIKGVKRVEAGGLKLASR